MKDEIKELIKLKQDSMAELESLEKDREELLGNAGRKQIILRNLEVADRVNLWTDEGRKTIRKEHAYLQKLLRIEEYIRRELNKLNQLEYNFYTKLTTEEIPLKSRSDLKNELLRIISTQDPRNDVNFMGILQLITRFYKTHTNETNYEAELGKLLTEEMIQELIN